MGPSFTGIADSLSIGASVSAPGSGSTIVSLAAPPAGVYDIELVYALSGTAETSLQNARIMANAANLANPLPTISGSGWVKVTFPHVTLDGVNVVKLVALGAATAGAVYSGIITATRVA